ncbi:SDR family oxidoreductase [Boseongicola aestuarii]|jgi:2-keto-3-deoxy-L-fuconate dehydrogenase|uniref:2-keto-3-deoxy-L-fuconate dehydrogenase n=1 Tax=Boseongicola aestuarii TaxID=1470561 RepID=A0A238J0J6_9RHOB|nr:SDR family oxidoreductase [Boseongicola aestuarii]SMX23695.1 2-keto-3-deoxy-L-fuconate dehydrogenase [Boseongicola aestuarii]
MQRLHNKTCLVTGAGAGIGYATVEAFIAEGANVIAIDRTPVGLADLASRHSGLKTHVVDVTDAGAVKALIGGLDRLDVLFNCAGMVTTGDLLTCTPEDWTRTFDLNVTAIFHMCRHAVALMIKSGGGSIVNMGSVISSIGAAPDRLAYGASKAAVIGLSKSIALDYAAENVRCNVICPSAVETPSMAARIEAMDDPVAARRAFESRQPIGRMAFTGEIAEMAVYLASDLSGCVTGSTMIMDGGAKL